VSFLIIVRNTNGLHVTYFGSNSDSTSITVDQLDITNGNHCFSYIKEFFRFIDTHKVFLQQADSMYMMVGQHRHIHVSATPAKVVGHEFITVIFLD